MISPQIYVLFLPPPNFSQNFCRPLPAESKILISTFERLYVRVLCELELAQFAEINSHHWKLLIDFITS